MKIVSIVGARPQFIKLKLVSQQLIKKKHSHIYSDQYYDSNMSDVFFEGLEISKLKFNLEIGSGFHVKQTGRVIIKIEAEILQRKPDWVLVYGDTNSTLAGAAATSKINIVVVYIEAGLRLFNRSMPEELIGVVPDHPSNVLFAITKIAMLHLQKKGLTEISYLAGDLMADLLFSTLDSNMHSARIKCDSYLVLRINRASNTDDQAQLGRIIRVLSTFGTKALLIDYPRLVAVTNKFDTHLESKNIEPLGYHQMINLIKYSVGVITDSGGLQKEAFLVGAPCENTRAETEWPEIFAGKMNVLGPLAENLRDLIGRKVTSPTERPFGDGSASQKITVILENQDLGKAA
jgi:UDP-N-acetylglucosamine 2-epimerase (non-hydrolysing)